MREEERESIERKKDREKEEGGNEKEKKIEQEKGEKENNVVRRTTFSRGKGSITLLLKQCVN